ncbi:MAG: flagellar basal-body rod protein FlgF [Burkholderiales bacterium]|jgi:flagellar basal-body rod protein FlgF
MDRVIYTAMSGAKATMARQDALANNLANASTDGFRADLTAFRAVPIQGQGRPTRVHALEATAGFDAAEGPLSRTGRGLDVAVRGQGWIAVQGLDGNEAYTRAGSLELSADGTLQTKSGFPVMGDGGPITVPQGAEVTIGADGTVTAKQGTTPPTPVGQIKLVNAPPGELRKGADGLMRAAGGDPLPPDPAVRVVSGAVEGSNVNPVESMVGMIAAARQFEMQMKMLQTAESNEQRAAKLLTPNG